MRFVKKPNWIYVLPFVFLGFIIFFLFMGMKYFIHTDRFKKIITNELIFLLSAENIRIDYNKVHSHGFLILNFSHFKFQSNYDDEVLLDLENLHVNADFILSPIAIKFTFYAYVNDNTDLMGVYVAPLFKDIKIKDPRDINAMPGDLLLNLNNVPLRFITGLYRPFLSPMIWDQWNADITGSLSIAKNAPYLIRNMDLQSDLKITNPNFFFIDKNSQKTYVHLSSFKTELNYKYPHLEFTPWNIKAHEFQGNLAANGALFIDETYQAQFDVKIKGSDYLFTIFKNTFLCPAEQGEVTLRGFKTISCL